MPQVPYDPRQQVAPALDPTPRYVANVSPDTFGANIGNAVSNLGKTVEGAGNEIFARGVAMQDLYNHSEAQQADADYMQKSGELHADFSSKQGKDAVDAYPKYIQDLQDARKGIRDGLSNGMSQKLFDSQSLSTMGRTIFNGAGHAATQNKQYAIGASQARVDAISDRTLSTPADQDAFEDGVADAEDEVRAQGQLKGWAPEQTDEAVSQQTSALWSKRIQGLAKTQPITAGKMLEQATKDGNVQGEDISKLTNLVNQARYTTGSRMVSNDVMSGASGRWGTGPVDIKQAAEAIGKIESGGNYSTIGVQTSHGRALGKYQVMEEFLPEFLSKAGLPAMSTEDFLKNHSAQDQVFSANFGAYMKQTGSANDAASMWLTGKTQAEAGGAKDAFGTDSKAYVARFNAALAQGAPLAAKVDMGQRIARDQAPEDPLFPDYVRDRIETDNNRQLAIKRDDQFNDRQSVESALMGQDNSKLPTTVEELTSDPKTSDAWSRLEPSTQRRYMGVLARNAKGDHNWTDETLRTYQQIKGQAQADPADFVDRDVIGTDLPNSAKRELINLQQKLKGQAEGDPRVQRALNILAPDLQAAGIDKKDKEDYYQFVGSLSDQLQEFATDNKRAPKIDEVRQMGSRLLQSHVVPGTFWNSQQPMYQLPVPSDVIQRAKSLNPLLTDHQIQREYTQQKYQELYGGTPKTQPSVAVSQ